MGITKKIKLDSLFIFAFLALFPFGQIIRLSFNLGGLNVPLLPIDIVVGLAAIYTILFQREKTTIFKYFKFLLAAISFSYILSICVFKYEALYGLFYLVRVFAYVFFINYVWNFVRKSSVNKNLLSKSLLAVSVVSAVFGWVQFFIFPDIKPFFVYGWDMHLYRLVGTFLDPTFLGLIIVFGLVISITGYINSKNKRYLALTAFLLVSLAFTYSRASYVAFLAAVLVIAILKKYFRKLALLVGALLLILFFLPTARNKSIELTRQFSIVARVENYQEAWQIFKRFPVFGVGFDNLCAARNKYIGVESYSSHACSGSDSSMLLILATTGIVGFLVFFGAAYKIFVSLPKSHERDILTAASVALLIHSIFSNSIFFPWVMGYMGILLALSLKE